MTEGSTHLAHVDFDQELESTAVAGAVAVQKLIADRNNLREQLTASLAAQSELKRRLALLHQQYVEVATKVVAGMQHFDSAMRAAMAGRPELHRWKRGAQTAIRWQRSASEATAQW